MSPIDLLFLSILALCVVWAIIVKTRRHESADPNLSAQFMESEIFSHLPDNYRVINNVEIKTDTQTAIIDYVVTTPDAVFAIEINKARGQILGTDTDKKWRYEIEYRLKHRWRWVTYWTRGRFDNPVKLALQHKEALSKQLPLNPGQQIIPIVVFGADANLSYIKSAIHVINVEQLGPALFCAL